MNRSTPAPRHGPNGPPEASDTPFIVIVHSLRHAMAAAETAGDCHCPVILCSAPGAAGYGGAAWFLEIVEATSRAHPDVAVTGILDCGQDIAIALEALQAGASWILFQGSPAALAQVEDAARARGCRVNDVPSLRFDMRKADLVPDACRQFMASKPE